MTFLSTNGNFPFLQKRGSHLSTAPLFSSILTPHPVKSSFCAGFQTSLAILSAGSTIEKNQYEKIEGCEQSNPL